MSTNISVPERRRQTNSIDSDSKAIEVLLSSAKAGQWENVWKILGTPESPKSDRFFNVIPEKRRWGILHQAVYWNDRDVILKLLKYSACDDETKVKQCMSECGETTQMTALDIAREYEYPDMIAALSAHLNLIGYQVVPTFQPYDAGEALGLISVTLSAYKNTFHPKPIDPEKSIITLLGDIYKDIMNSDDRWKAIKEKVYDSVFVVCEENAKAIRSSTTRQEFFETVIRTYTLEKKHIYTYLNLAFRRQKSENYRPTGHDLAVGPYAVVYQILLLHWSDLLHEASTTYRRMLLSSKDAIRYQIGARFVWQSVVSSSTYIKNASAFPTYGSAEDLAVMFIIDNKGNNQWQPRNIEKYAKYMERERTYPAGAKFIVTGRTWKEGEINVSLKLLPE